jgi:AraC-like DNA-binding protein
MNPTNSFLADALIFISALGFVQGFIFSMIIPFKDRKGNWQCNNFLSIYVLSMSGLMLMPLIEKYIGWQYSWWIYPLVYVMNPALLCYIKSFTRAIAWAEIALHFSFSLAFVFIGYYYNEYTVAAVGDRNPYLILLEYSYFDYFILFSVLGHWIVYSFLSLRAVNQHHRFVQENFSEISKIDLIWVKQLVWGNLLILIASIILQILQFQVSNGYENYILNALNVAFVTPYLYFAFMKGIRQPSLFEEKYVKVLAKEITYSVDNQTIEKGVGQVKILESVINEMIEKPKYEKNKITEDKAKSILNQIVSSMEEDKKFLEPELSLQSLSEDLQIPSHQISQVLNLHLQKNFYDFVNHYRVEEVKKELQNPKKQHLSILAIAFDSGFNSKSTFNTVFKQHTSLTPSAYRKQS